MFVHFTIETIFESRKFWGHIFFVIATITLIAEYIYNERIILPIFHRLLNGWRFPYIFQMPDISKVAKL